MSSLLRATSYIPFRGFSKQASPGLSWYAMWQARYGGRELEEELLHQGKKTCVSRPMIKSMAFFHGDNEALTEMAHQHAFKWRKKN